MDERVSEAVRLMMQAAELLDECKEYLAAAHLQHAIDSLAEHSSGDTDRSLES